MEAIAFISSAFGTTATTATATAAMTAETAGMVAAQGAFAATTPTIFTAANLQLAGTALSGVSSIMQSQQQAEALRLQSAQAALQGRQNALNYNRQALQIYERQQRLAATARARAVAGGVDPFSGSALTVQQVDAIYAGKEAAIARENAEMAVSGGLAQSQSLRSAAAATEAYGMVAGAAKGLMGLARYQDVRIPSVA